MRWYCVFVLARLALEELDSALAQRDGDLYALIPEYEILGTREEVGNDPQVSETFAGIPNLLAHRGISVPLQRRRRKRGAAGGRARGAGVRSSGLIANTKRGRGWEAAHGHVSLRYQ